MPDTRAPTVPQFTRRLGIETPEHLVLELELAGLGSRMAATVCDAGLLVLAFVLLGLAIQLLSTPTGGDAVGPWSTRSEEHTSELQSLTNLVCSLLLAEKRITMDIIN